MLTHEMAINAASLCQSLSGGLCCSWGRHQRSRKKAWKGILAFVMRSTLRPSGLVINWNLCTLPILSQVGCIVWMWPLLRGHTKTRALDLVKGQGQSLTGIPVKSLIRGEDDGCVRGPQRPRSRPEQCRAQEWGLDEGGGAHRVAQSQRVSSHCAQSWWGEGAGQEASSQTLGQLLLQGQFGLEKTGMGDR